MSSSEAEQLSDLQMRSVCTSFDCSSSQRLLKSAKCLHSTRSLRRSVIAYKQGTLNGLWLVVHRLHEHLKWLLATGTPTQPLADACAFDSSSALKWMIICAHVGLWTSLWQLKYLRPEKTRTCGAPTRENPLLDQTLLSDAVPAFSTKTTSWLSRPRSGLLN